MWQFLLHLWQAAPADLPLVCPDPAAGQPADPQGFYDFASIAPAFHLAAIASAFVVVFVVVVCYQFTRTSLGERFVKRWWVSVIASGLLCLGVVWLSLATFPTTALAGSCSTNPGAFPIALPTSLVISRAMAGLVWGLVAFALLSSAATAVLGRFPHRSNGFFHHRGCPLPRFLP